MRFLREPLLHFVVLGGILFGLYSLVGQDAGEAPGEIVVTAGQIASLRDSFKQVWRRPPSAAETEGLIAEYIRDEVLYREALAMGLDEDDAVIRRRLRQKFEFVAAEVADAEPTDAELKTYIAEHPERFLTEPHYSFRHVYFRTDDAAARPEAEAQRLLANLRGQPLDADTTALGDRFLLGDVFDVVAQSYVKRIFGPEFVDALADLPVGTWEGPIASGYGLHLVQLGTRSDAATPPFEVIRDLAEREWQNDRRVEASEALFQNLKSRYSITIEGAEARSGRMATATP